METTKFRDYQILHEDPRKPDPRYVREYHKQDASGIGGDYVREGTGTGPVHMKGYLPLLTLSGTDNEDGTATVTLTVTDWMSNAVSDAYLIRVWLSASALGAPADPGDIAATTGRIIVEETGDCVFTLATNAAGVAVLTLTATSNGTQVIHAAIIGKITAGSIAITGNS